MDRETYLKMLEDMYYRHFDIYEDREIGGREFDLYACCRITNERYMATRSLKIYQYNDYEHCLVRAGEKFSGRELDDEFFDRCVEELIEVESGHHQSYLTLIQVVGKPLSSAEITRVENCSYSRSFWFGLRGWCDLRLLAVDLDRMKVFFNEEAKEGEENYRPSPLAEKLGYET